MMIVLVSFEGIAALFSLPTSTIPSKPSTQSHQPMAQSITFKTVDTGKAAQ